MIGLEVNLKEFLLGEVLQFLARLKKTGVLKIEGSQTGEIYLKEGFVVHATDGVEKGIDMLIGFSFSDLGRAVFEPDIPAPEQTINEDIGKLTEDVEKRRIEFLEIKKRLPPLETVLAKSTKDLESAVALRRTDWQILALVDGKRTVSEIIAQCKLGGYEATKTLVWLKEKNLIYDPREAERIMAGLLNYLNVYFQIFAGAGWEWLQKWSAAESSNQRLLEALAIDHQSFKIELREPLSTEEIENFFSSFPSFIGTEGPNTFGKLLFKKKYDELTKKTGNAG